MHIPGIDPLVPLVGVAALVAFALHGFRGELTRDLAFYAYAGQAFAGGLPPYEGIFNQTGPLAHAAPALGVWAARLAGVDELLGMRLVFCVIAAGCVSATYAVGRDIFVSRGAGVVAAASLSAMSGFVEYASNGPREKSLMVLFLLLSLGAGTRHRWFAAGLFVGLGTLVLQTVFFVGAPALLVAIIFGADRGDTVKALTRFVAGGCAGLAAVLGYFIAVGAVRSFLDGFVLVNLRYPTGHRLDIPRIGEKVIEGFGVSTVFIVVGLVGACLLPVVQFSRRHQAPAHFAMGAGLTAGTASGLLWLLVDFDTWPDAFALLPVSALGVAGLVDTARRYVPSAAGIVIGTCVVAAAVAVCLVYSLAERDYKLDRQRASVAEMQRLLGDDLSIASIQAPQPLVLARMRNPSRYQLLSGPLGRQVDDTWPGGLKGYIEWLLRERPALIAIGPPAINRWAQRIRPEYRLVGCAVNWKWYASRTMDADTRRILISRGVPCQLSADARLVA